MKSISDRMLGSARPSTATDMSEDPRKKHASLALSLEDFDELQDERRGFYETQRPSSMVDERIFYTFNNLKDTDGSLSDEELQRLERVKMVLRHEIFLYARQRQLFSDLMSPDMLTSQLDQLDSAYEESNFLRAELWEMTWNKSVFAFKSSVVPKWLIATSKENAGHQAYAAAVLMAATDDACRGLSNCEWTQRVRCDFLVVKDCQRIRSAPARNKTLSLRKKHLLDLKRAKAILRADLTALKTCWPGVDYSFLTSESGTELI